MGVEDIKARLEQIAREASSDDDVATAGDRICAAAVELLGKDAQAGISLAHRGRRVQNVGATAEVVRRGDQLQVELGEGPCIDAAWEHEQVLSRDLAQESRWPQWGPTMVRHHALQSMLCTQMFTTREQLGALNIYSTEPDAFDEEDQEVARLLAVHAAVVVAAAQRIENLTIAVDRRTTIGKALGIIMVQYDLDDELAFAVLRRLSRDGNRKLFDIAQDVVTARGLPHSAQQQLAN